MGPAEENINPSVPATTNNQQQCVINPTYKNNRITKRESVTVINDINQSSEDSAVCIRNLCKRYDVGPPVVQNYCMNVKKGSIYGLLGSSGCGKTTILSCIVGLRKWDSGDVLVFGKKPGSKESGIPGKRLGYMPQELALYNQLSTREIIQFYGRIYNMSNREINEQWRFLTKLLDLPTKFKIVGELSGGQKRRASLALALIHSPELLVLDEPTVGLDPLLRQSIWNHLFKIVNKLGTTILITTHYIEEARHSNMIGVMRKGRLLVEDSPMNLLNMYNCQLLEQVVLKLCHKDETLTVSTSSLEENENQVEFKSKWNKNILASNNVTTVALSKKDDQDDIMNHGQFRKRVEFDSDVVDNSKENISRKISHQNKSSGLSKKIRNTQLFQAIRRIYGLTIVILSTFIRHPGFLALLLCMPSLQGTITLFAFGSKPRDMPFGIVNHDSVNWSAECGLPQHASNSCDLTAISCKYINKIRSDDLLILEPYDNEDKALEQVRQGNSWGYLVIPHNYSQHALDLVVAKRFAMNETFEGTRFSIHLDYSQYVNTFFTIKHLLYSYQDYVQQLHTACDFGGKELEIPLYFRTPVYGNIDSDNTPFTMPGVIIVSLSAIVSALTALLFVGDRKQGTLDRAHAAGMGAADVMAAHILTQSIVTIGQVIIWSLVLHFLFKFENQGSEWLCLLFYLVTGIYGAGIGLFIGVICKDEVEALMAGVFIIPFFLLFGGVFFPMERMATFWRYVGYIIPICWPTHALRSVVIRGLGLTHPLVYPGFLVVVAYGVIFPVLSILIYKKSRK